MYQLPLFWFMVDLFANQFGQVRVAVYLVDWAGNCYEIDWRQLLPNSTIFRCVADWLEVYGSQN